MRWLTLFSIRSFTTSAFPFLAAIYKADWPFVFKQLIKCNGSSVLNINFLGSFLMRNFIWAIWSEEPIVAHSQNSSTLLKIVNGSFWSLSFLFGFLGRYLKGESYLFFRNRSDIWSSQSKAINFLRNSSLKMND